MKIQFFKIEITLRSVTSILIQWLRRFLNIVAAIGMMRAILSAQESIYGRAA